MERNSSNKSDSITIIVLCVLASVAMLAMAIAHLTLKISVFSMLWELIMALGSIYMASMVIREHKQNNK